MSDQALYDKGLPIRREGHVAACDRVLWHPGGARRVQGGARGAGEGRGDQWKGGIAMCRNIKTLFNFVPPATEREIRDASLQFVRKLSGFNAPSKTNEAAFDRAVDDVALIASRLITSLVTNAVPKSREVEVAKAKARSALRFDARR